jgi:predicted GNAT family N-acyltransferase
MLDIKLLKGTDDLKEAFEIRKKVFIIEQNVPPELEWDELDKLATHFVLYLDKTPIGTARVFKKDSNWSIGRMAILKECRGKGYGKFIMENIMNFLKAKNLKKIIIHAQITVLGFYQKFGFQEIGDEFLDAGIKHKEMVYYGRNV